MTYSRGSRALLLVIALAAVVTLSATVALADCVMKDTSAMPSSSVAPSPITPSDTAAAQPCPAEVQPSAAATQPSPAVVQPSSSAAMMAELGSGSASSLTQDAWLVKGDPTGNDVSRLYGLISFGVHRASSAPTSAGFDYGLAKFMDPSDKSVYELRFTGLDQTSPDVKYGGVALLKPVFGSTGLGPTNLPQTVAYIAAFGRGDVYKNGQKIASDVPAHVVVTPGLRNDSGQLLAANNLDLDARQISLLVPGPVSGLPDNKLFVTWNSAALTLTDVGGRPLTQRQVAMVTFPESTGVVAGAAAEVPMGEIRLSLQNNGFNSTITDTLTSGLTTITVVNNSSMSRGAIIKAKDVIGSPIVRYTPILRPGQSYSFNTYLGSGSFTAMDYHGMTRGMQRWRSNYQTSFSIGM